MAPVHPDYEPALRSELEQYERRGADTRAQQVRDELVRIGAEPDPAETAKATAEAEAATAAEKAKAVAAIAAAEQAAKVEAAAAEAEAKKAAAAAKAEAKKAATAPAGDKA